MVGGYWTRYYSIFLKGLFVLSIKERINARRTIAKLKRADRMLYKKLWKDVEGEHRIVKAEREEDSLIRDLEASLNNAYNLLFNISIEDQKLLEIVQKILEELKGLSVFVTNYAKSLAQDDARKLEKIVREIANTILYAIRKGEGVQRTEYRHVMLIINEAEEKDHNKFMANVRLIFQQEKAQTILTKFVIRGEIRRARIDIQQLAKVPSKISAIKQHLKKGKKEIPKAVGELQGTINEIKDHCWDAFYQLYLIIRRDMFFTLKALLDLNNLKAYNNRWVGKKFMPQEPIRQKNQRIDIIEGNLAKEFHIMAQGFRIMIHGIEKEEAEAKSLAKAA